MSGARQLIIFRRLRSTQSNAIETQDLLHSGVIGVLTGFTRMLSRCNCIKRLRLAGRKKPENIQDAIDGAYLITILGIKQNPSQLNHLGRILGHVHSMFVAGSRNVYNDVAVQLRDGGRNGGHGSLRRGYARGIGRKNGRKNHKRPLPKK